MKFDQNFPGPVDDEFKAREKAIAGKAIKWNYDKYAYCTIQSTGESLTIIASEQKLILGDGAAYNRKPHINLYTTEGGVRKFKPQLKSCKITNEGGQDYTDSYLYNVEFSFTVFTQADLNAAEATFMRVGGGIRVDFGWKGLEGVNKGFVEANIFNFDFSMNDDGSFDCNIKAMSPAGLWSGEDMASVDNEKVDNDEEPTNFLSSLEAKCREAFGLDSDDGPDSVSDLGNNKLRVEAKKLGGLECVFGAAELIIEPGFWNDDEQYIFYTTIGTLIRYINSKGDTDKNTYKVQQGGKTASFPKIECLGSADPKDFFLPGFQGSYGDPSDGGNAKNFSKWGENLENGASYDTSDIEKIAVSFPFLTKTYQSMADKTKTVGGFKQSVKIAEFLKTIFDRLENVTGGLVTLSAIPLKGGQPLQPDNQKPPFDITIMNKKMIENDTGPKAFTFKTLAKDSITKAVSLSSEFDADYILMATKANIEKGTSNGHFLTKPKKGPYPQNGALKEPPKVESSDILDMRNEMGDKGASPERITAYGDACRAYIIQNSKADSNLAEGRYGEIQYTLNLSVTIDGVWGIPFLAPIKIDRMPSVFNTKGVLFTVIAVNHEFDGKGGWETSLETVMRIP